MTSWQPSETRMMDEWPDRVSKFLVATCGNPSPLDGASVWLGRSVTGPAALIADSMTVALEQSGATVGVNVSGMRGIVCGPEAERIDEHHAVLMIAATPGVTAEAMDFCRDELWTKPISPRMHVLVPNEHSDGYMYARLQELGAKTDLYPAGDVDSGRLATTGLCRVIAIYRNMKLEEDNVEEPKPLVGIVTALPLEYAAVKSAIPGGRKIRFRTQGAGLRSYLHMKLPAAGGGEHEIVLVNAGMGNNKSVAAAKQLMNDYPTVQDVIMVGIAAGVPNLSNAKLDVRLGDVVISNAKGVIKYDMKKVTTVGETRNHDPRPPSHDWLVAAEEIADDQEAKEDVWASIDECCETARSARPERDELIDTTGPEAGEPLERPKDPSRTVGRPRFMFGPIGSADTVVKSASHRNEIAAATGIMAIEMEGSGIAEVMWQSGGGYLIVRGICDYANDAKNKEWQDYAAIAAASFTRRLIESMPVMQPTD